MKIELTGKTALITGGSSGIGEACVKVFCEAGADVFFTYNKSADNAQMLAKKYSCTAIKCDAASQEQCKQAVEEAAAKTGKLDILINNAGIFIDAPAGSTHYLEAWKKTIEVNLTSSAACIHYAVPYMKEGGAKIVNISSIHSVEGSMNASAYHSSKAGMDGLTRSFAVELAPYNIQVNSIGPGAIMTPMWGDAPGDFIKMVTDIIPAKRYARPEEVAFVALFMASSFANYITGQTLFVDGGMLVNVFKQ